VHAKLLSNRIRDVRDADRKGEAVLLFQLHFQIGNVVLEVSLLELGVQFLLITAQEKKLHLLAPIVAPLTWSHRPQLFITIVFQSGASSFTGTSWVLVVA